jgi:hypothetical protein
VKPVYLQANVDLAWLNTTNPPAKPTDMAWIAASIVGHPGEKVMVHFNPATAAALGRRLLDWASSADPVTAVEAVGSVIRGDGR